MALNLGSLIAKQKAETNVAKPLPASDSGQPTEGAYATVPAQASPTDPVEAKAVAPQVPENVGGVLKGLKFGGGAAKPQPAAEGNSGPSDAGKGVVGGAVATRSDDSASRPATPAKPAAGSSNELAALFDTEELGIEPAGRAETPITMMPDLIDVQCPERDLPEGISLEAGEFVGQLNQIYDIVHDPELFGQFVRTIMQELQEHPEYIKLMAPSDSHVMIAGLRQSMGLAQIKKEVKKRPAAATTRAKKGTKTDELTAILDGMEGMVFD